MFCIRSRMWFWISWNSTFDGFSLIFCYFVSNVLIIRYILIKINHMDLESHFYNFLFFWNNLITIIIIKLPFFRYIQFSGSFIFNFNRIVKDDSYYSEQYNTLGIYMKDVFWLSIVTYVPDRTWEWSIVCELYKFVLYRFLIFAIWKVTNVSYCFSGFLGTRVCPFWHLMSYPLINKVFKVRRSHLLCLDLVFFELIKDLIQ